MRDRLKSAIGAIVRELLPDFRFYAPAEYRITKAEAGKFSASCTAAAVGLPAIEDAPIRGSILGGHTRTKLTRGTTVLVAFINGDPGRPVLIAGSDTVEPSETVVGGELVKLGGESDGTAAEHVMTTEAAVLLVFNVLATLMAAAGGGPLLAVVLQPLLLPAILAALTAQGAPAPPGLAAQIAAAASLGSSMAAGTTPSPTLGPIAAGLSVLDTKTADVSGLFPSIGAKRTRTG